MFDCEIVYSAQQADAIKLKVGDLVAWGFTSRWSYYGRILQVYVAEVTDTPYFTIKYEIGDVCAIHTSMSYCQKAMNQLVSHHHVQSASREELTDLLGICSLAAL